MDTIEKIFYLIKLHNTNANTVAKDLGFGNSQFTSWKNGVAKPSADALSKIADYFDVSVDYLLGREETKKLPDGFPTDSNFNSDLKKMGFSTEAYDSMTESEKQALVTTITSLAENFRKNKK